MQTKAYDAEQKWKTHMSK